LRNEKASYVSQLVVWNDINRVGSRTSKE
jgi:hypothetical protein